MQIVCRVLIMSLYYTIVSKYPYFYRASALRVCNTIGCTVLLMTIFPKDYSRIFYGTFQDFSLEFDGKNKNDVVEHSY